MRVAGAASFLIHITRCVFACTRTQGAKERHLLMAQDENKQGIAGKRRHTKKSRGRRKEGEMRYAGGREVRE